ncbi:hypothetical protein EMIHUDRAFT_101970 [Emiliania huxleyi CCMP1516]|uniref:Uncharacterized protein n=2 Tax=Emiliania huxleyi TaxID=2903 RepID=A0A0D3J8V8_EMIH1|nr:hypothetical protein EMIHUDRAFT_101970 [Emiliania huxleyi CCMP1516]EOD19943.1 hypothetical protein EMIHUDRAFT_101970 [Emiliania huxleyi CCMP1516]|eukprot:XP_005772372.1 hypothetical protein EMIHUDRAFT_101970 [Emiliania huxleyi CCMP1516]
MASLHPFLVLLSLARASSLAIEAGPLGRELFVARRAASAVGGLLAAGGAVSAGEALLAESLRGAAVAAGRWVTHIEAGAVSIAYLGRPPPSLEDGLGTAHTAPLVGVVWRGGSGGEGGIGGDTFYATANGGAWQVRGGGEPVEAALGGASPVANVVSCSHGADCAEVEMMARMLRETGTGMPLEIRRPPARGGETSADVDADTAASAAASASASADVLLDLLTARADVLVDPSLLGTCSEPARRALVGRRLGRSAEPAGDASVLPYFARSSRAAFPLRGECALPLRRAAKVVDADGWELGLGGVGEGGDMGV